MLIDADSLSQTDDRRQTTDRQTTDRQTDRSSRHTMEVSFFHAPPSNSAWQRRVGSSRVFHADRSLAGHSSVASSRPFAATADPRPPQTHGHRRPTATADPHSHSRPTATADPRPQQAPRPQRTLTPTATSQPRQSRTLRGPAKQLTRQSELSRCTVTLCSTVTRCCHATRAACAHVADHSASQTHPPPAPRCPRASRPTGTRLAEAFGWPVAAAEPVPAAIKSQNPGSGPMQHPAEPPPAVPTRRLPSPSCLSRRPHRPRCEPPPPPTHPPALASRPSACVHPATHLPPPPIDNSAF